MHFSIDSAAKAKNEHSYCIVLLEILKKCNNLITAVLHPSSANDSDEKLRKQVQLCFQANKQKLHSGGENQSDAAL